LGQALIIEDSEPDARLLVRTLRQADYALTWERVETAEAMRAALERQPWDVILSDYKMPHFSGSAALQLLQESGLDLPFIVVSGTIGEENAVAMMKTGAHDYILKGNLARLAPAIAREMREAEVRRARCQAEAELQTVNRGLRVLSSVNQALLRATSEQELLQQTCDIAVVEGGYQLVWIGMAEDDAAKTVCPVSFAGHEDGYLQIVRFSWDAESALGRGSTGVAIRTGQPAFAREIATAPDYTPWREEALRRGYRSSIAAPIIVDDRVIGAISLYGPQPDAFPPDEVKLLAELAGDLGFGITTLRTREAHRQVEEALREREARLRLITDNSPDAILMIDEESRIHFANPATETIFGYPLAEMQGQSVTMLMPERLRERHLGAMHHYLTTGQRHFPSWQNIEVFGVHQSGRELPLELSYGEFRRGDARFFIGVVRDITERKQFEEQLRQRVEELETVMEVAPAAIWVTHDPHGDEITGNRWANQFDEAPAGENVSPNVVAARRFFVDGRELSSAELPMQVAATQGIDVQNREVEVLTPSGRRYVLFGNASPLRSATGEVRGSIAVFIDITDRKQAEETSKRERAYLSSAIEVLPVPILFFTPTREMILQNKASRELQAAADTQFWWTIRLLDPQTHVEIPQGSWPVFRALRGDIVSADEYLAVLPDGQEMPVLLHSAPVVTDDTMRAAVVAIQDITALKEADQAKNQFIRMISHEMRTPLTAVIGWAQLAAGDPTLCADALQAILHSARVQEEVLDRLILLARMLTGKLTVQFQPVDLQYLAIQVVDSYQPVAQERRITCESVPSAESLPVQADPHLLQQAFSELLDNALNNTPAGGQVTLTMARHDNQAVVCVHDTGQGIAPEHLPRLGQPFQQIVREEARGGLGIGLLLVRGIVEAHGGQVFITSPGIGQGTTVTVALPAMPASQAMPARRVTE
jgi:PAS domain S-box-containing protein